MKQLLKRFLRLLVPACCIFVLAACKSPSGPVNYNVAGVASDIPTITSVVGERDFVGSSVTRYAKAEEGNLSVTCAYSGAANAAEDIKRYCNALTTKGFSLQTAFDGHTAVLTTPSTIEGQHIQITVTMNSDNGYTILTEIMENNDTSSVLASSSASTTT